jgi:spore germination protein GerM
MIGRITVIGGLIASAAALAWLLFVVLPRRAGSVAPNGTASAASAATPSPGTPGRRIKARLFYVADDGLHLVRVERDVAYGEGAVEQAREIIAAQIAPAVEPLVSAIPQGTAMRAVFLTERGEAYVDLSPEVVTGHTGGTVDELLTVYTIVDALTENLPAVTSVQLLVDGKQVDTLVGHVDLRNPLVKNLTWVQ